MAAGVSDGTVERLDTSDAGKMTLERGRPQRSRLGGALGPALLPHRGEGQAADVDVLEPSDALLLHDVLAGDEAALERLYRRFAPAVFRSARRKLCNARLAEDVVQHVFLLLWDHPERFDAGRGSLRSYLLMLAHCHSVDLIRSESARRHRETIDGMAVVDAGHDPEAALLGSHEIHALRRAIDMLSDREREAIELAFFEGYTYREVANLLDEPEGTVKSRIRLGLNRLRSALVD